MQFRAVLAFGRRDRFAEFTVSERVCDVLDLAFAAIKRLVMR